MSNAEFTAMALAAPTLQLSSQIVAPVRRARILNLAALRGLTIAAEVENAPRVLSVPAQVETALTGADGKVYFVPQARVAKRSEATGAPHVFLAKSAGVVTLQVYFDLVRFPVIAEGAEPLPVDGYTVSLVPASGAPIVFERCDNLPRGDEAPEVLSRLYCETTVDPNIVVPMLENGDAVFRVEGDVHYTTQDAVAAPSDQGGIRVVSSDRVRVFDTAARAIRLQDITAMTAMPLVRDHRVIATPTVGGPAAPAPEPQWSSHTVRLSLGVAAGIPASYPANVMNNRAIYSQVTSGFGSEPWSEWVTSPNGMFMDSPVPDQFYIVPKEYRLAFDAETKQPAMLVLLVPPTRAEGAEAPTSFGADYTLRTRFSLVPWNDPESRESLRAEIAKHSGRPYPDLVVGGIRSATCRLSDTLVGLGASIVGTEGTTVDGMGFDLVLDCTSEFYTSLTRLLVSEGVQAKVTLTLVSDEADPQVRDVLVNLRLDRPAGDFLTAELLPPVEPEPAPVPAEAVPAEPAPAEPVPAEAVPAEAVPAEPAAAEPTPEVLPVVEGPSIVRVSNPLPYAVTVKRIVASLLVSDDRTPSPIAAVAATPEPASFQLPAATDVPSTIDIALTAAASDQPRIFGSVGVAFEGVTVEIDPEQVLAKAYDTSATGSVSSSIEVRCYQLEHPDELPPALATVFGLEVEIRRSAEAKAITAFLTKDQPRLDVQVSFSLGDIAAGMRPEQPTFEWRRRNMSGAGNGEWSEWASITGRQLFVTPTGM